MNESIIICTDPAEDTQADFIMIATGDSMTGANIRDGDMIFLKRQETVNNGEIAAVDIDGKRILKRFYKHGDTVTLKAENPEYKDMIFTPADRRTIKILGKAVAVKGRIK